MAKSFYKHPTYGFVYGEVIKTPEGRLCWPALVKPKDPPPPQEGQQPGAPRYEVTILLPKEVDSTKNFLSVVEKMTDEMLVIFNQGRKAKLSKPDTIIADGDTFDLEKYPYYAGNYVLTARNQQVPVLVGADKTDVSPEVFLGGCLVKAIVTPLVTAHGVSYKLNVAQFIKDDGVRFGGGNSKANYLSMLDDSEETPAEETAEVTEALKAASKPAVKKGKDATLDVL